MSLSDKVLKGDVRAAARLMRDVDDEIPSAVKELKRLYPHTGNAYYLGITGAPGVGKSTLVDQLISVYRNKGITIGGLVVDPSSPFTGGAILGDRIRMQRHSTDSGVFLRSIATRGHLGGLTRSTLEMAHVLDAMGKDIIILETVGVGQDEVEVANNAHTTVVVIAPGMGDDIQAIKAGILEVADIFVINKAEVDGADRLKYDLEMTLDMGAKVEGRNPPILPCVAPEGRGIEDLLEGIEAHRKYLLESGELRARTMGRTKHMFLSLLQKKVTERILKNLEAQGRMEGILDSLCQKEIDPYTLIDEICKEHLKD